MAFAGNVGNASLSSWCLQKIYACGVRPMGPVGPVALGCKSGLQNLVRKRKLHGGRSLRRLHVDPPLTSAHVGDLPASLHGVAAHGEGESNGLRTTAESESNFLPVTQRQNGGYNELFKEAPKHQKRDCKNKKKVLF